MRDKILKFIQSTKDYPIILGLSVGLYPVFYLYNNNFNLVNSWSQFFVFVLTFLILPALLSFLLFYILNSIKNLKIYKAKIISVFNFCLFTLNMLLVTYGVNKKKLLIISILISIVLGLLLFKQLKKIVLLQFLLASVALVSLGLKLYSVMTYSYDWQNQPDQICQIQFKQHPNIYVLQPDGFVGFDELEKGYYNFDNSDVSSFLEENRFTIYDNFRSNYMSTLTSNSSMFSMKHHYYGAYNEVDRFYKARGIIAGKNPVLDILNANNYKTHLILDVPYLIVNRPKISYDYCNITFNDIDYLSRGFEFENDTEKDLLTKIQSNENNSNFYFVRETYPGHIQTRKANSKGKLVERNIYLDRLKQSNIWLKGITSKIVKADPRGIIIISSDHGGFVGYDYTLEHQTKTLDRDLIYSTFSSALAVKWSDKDVPNYKNELKSSVNIFRVLFSYLSEDSSYLNNLEDNSSYSRINKDAETGVYQVINNEGEVVFSRFSN